MLQPKFIDNKIDKTNVLCQNLKLWLVVLWLYYQEISSVFSESGSKILSFLSWDISQKLPRCRTSTQEMSVSPFAKEIKNNYTWYSAQTFSFQEYLRSRVGCIQAQENTDVAVQNYGWNTYSYNMTCLTAKFSFYKKVTHSDWNV